MWAFWMSKWCLPWQMLPDIHFTCRISLVWFLCCTIKYDFWGKKKENVWPQVRSRSSVMKQRWKSNLGQKKEPLALLNFGRQKPLEISMRFFVNYFISYFMNMPSLKWGVLKGRSSKGRFDLLCWCHLPGPVLNSVRSLPGSDRRGLKLILGSQLGARWHAPAQPVDTSVCS